MFSNQAVYAQKGSSGIFSTDATTNLLKRSAQDINKGDLYLGLTANQISHKSLLKTRDEKSEFKAMNRKYYWKDDEITKASPVLLTTSFNCFSLTKDSTSRAEITQFYLTKSKHQETAAWLMLGVGSTMVIVGVIGGMSSFRDTEALSNFATYDTIMLIGLAADVVCIPFFISAHHNKKKATSLSFGNQTIYFPLDKSYCGKTVPSLTLRIKL